MFEQISPWQTFQAQGWNKVKLLINRQGVAGAVLQTAASSFIHYFSHSLIQSSFSSQSSTHHKSQTVRARELKFDKKFTPHLVSQVTCHVAYVTCQASGVVCHRSAVMFQVSCVFFFLLFFC